jgi:hypothetical protein
MDARKALLLLLSGELLGSDLDAVKERVRTAMTRDPMGSALSTVVLGATLFYEAEKGHNPDLHSFTDALMFVSTTLTSTSSDVRPRTEKGKLIVSALRMVGPSVAFNFLNPMQKVVQPEPAAKALPREEKGARRQDAQKVLRGLLLDRLDEMLTKLETERAAALPPSNT